MKENLLVTKYLPVRRKEVFAAWTHPDLLEEWCYSTGMTLKVEQLEPVEGGRFNFIHSTQVGDVSTSGIFHEVLPDQKLVFSALVKGPGGRPLLDSKLTVEFKDKEFCTEIIVLQEGFTQGDLVKACQESWAAALENLKLLLGKGLRPGPQASFQNRDVF